MSTCHINIIVFQHLQIVITFLLRDDDDDDNSDMIITVIMIFMTIFYNYCADLNNSNDNNDFIDYYHNINSSNYDIISHFDEI